MNTGVGKLHQMLFYAGLEPEEYQACLPEIRKDNRKKLRAYLIIAGIFLLVIICLLGGLTCDSEDFYNSECHTSAIFLPKLEAGNTQYIGFFHTGAYQESLGGFGGIQHCLIPAPKHVIIDRDKSDNEYYTRLFAKEQSYRSMLRILGY